jgi:catechol 2,3-dioxygenase-like lactoylglutathione lyase family enzyme
MSTIDHVTIRVSDLAAGRKFYGDVFALLPFTGERHDGKDFVEWNDFSIAQADADHPPTRGLHIGFAADSHEQIEAWWEALTRAGYSDDGAPGPRPEYGADYYGAFVRDADDNSVEAVRHGGTTSEPGLIDHLWIRVVDLDPVQRFYSEIAPVLGLYARERPNRLQVVAEGATFSFLEGRRTENVHLAVGVDDRKIVADFHAAALAAGGRDNGPPRERPRYHPGYYAAYVLDPAGTNLEAVLHDRRTAG